MFTTPKTRFCMLAVLGSGSGGLNMSEHFLSTPEEMVSVYWTEAVYSYLISTGICFYAGPDANSNQKPDLDPRRKQIHGDPDLDPDPGGKFNAGRVKSDPDPTLNKRENPIG